MEAAFVEIGLEKNGFLYVDEIVGPELEGRKGAKKIQDLIRRGETVLVQAVKDPMKSKGARLTTEISLPGRFLVYVPNGEGYGVSRRLEDDERTRLKEIVKALDAKGGGIIVRTAAEGASAEDIERDLVFLQRLWKTIQTKTKGATAPSIVYEEAELPLRIVRDLFAGDFSSALIDDDRTYRRIVSYLKKTSPHMIERVQRYREKPPLFEAYGVDKEIQSTLERRVNLPSGGYLVFDYAEAFTVIDVNTGRFVGSRGKSSAGRLEDTIVKNNLEAVKEVVRQLRLRDIGGIIVIDFIDMSNPKNRETVEDALRTELERDRTKTYVVEISPLGLVEMTRQNVTDGPREILTRRCPVCEGDGFVVSDETMAIEIERRLRALAAGGARAQAFRVAVHPRVLSLLAGRGGGRLAADRGGRAAAVLPRSRAENGHVHLDHFEVLEQGKLEALKPAAPFAEDETISLKLVEVGLYDPSAGVGKLDGYDVVVADAAKLVGKKVSVTVGRVLDGVAFAVPAEEVSADGGITFEAEAEKPTRAPSRKKVAETPAKTPKAEPERGGRRAEVEDVDDEAPDEAAPEAETDEATGRRSAEEEADAPWDEGRTRPEEEACGRRGSVVRERRRRRQRREGRRRRSTSRRPTSASPARRPRRPTAQPARAGAEPGGRWLSRWRARRQTDSRRRSARGAARAAGGGARSPRRTARHRCGRRRVRQDEVDGRAVADRRTRLPKARPSRKRARAPAEQSRRRSTCRCRSGSRTSTRAPVRARPDAASSGHSRAPLRYHSAARGQPARDSFETIVVTYAIIKVAGKQYRVREGERLLVDRLAADDGSTFSPDVLLVGGDGSPCLAPSDVKVTARVLGGVKGPKVRIGKYKKRTGYRRHTGFRASLTQIEIESIGGGRKRSAPAKDEAAKPEPKEQAARRRRGEGEAAAPRRRPIGRRACRRATRT